MFAGAPLKDRDHSGAEGMTVDKTKGEHGNVKRETGNNKDRGEAWKPFKGIKWLLVGELGEPLLIAWA